MTTICHVMFVALENNSSILLRDGGISRLSRVSFQFLCIRQPYSARSGIKNRPLSKKRPQSAVVSIKVLPFQSQAGKAVPAVIDAGDAGRSRRLLPFTPCKTSGIAYADSIPQPCPICKRSTRIFPIKIQGCAASIAFLYGKAAHMVFSTKAAEKTTPRFSTYVCTPTWNPPA